MRPAAQVQFMCELAHEMLLHPLLARVCSQMEVVISRAFFPFSPCNHFINK